MRKLICVFMCLVCFVLVVNANTVVFEDDFNETDFTQNEFWSSFNCYNSNESNYVMQGDNGYYHGKWTEGASAVYIDELEDYTLIAKLKTSGNTNQEKNCYKSAVLLRMPLNGNSYIFEPDNGDEDGSSYLGSSGIYFYCYGNTLEVAVHTKKNGGTSGPVNAPEGFGTTAVVEDAAKRHYGVYSVSYHFTLPEGKTFDEFRNIKVVDKKENISFYVDDTLLCELLLSNIGEVNTVIGENYWNKDIVGDDVFDGQSYKTVVVKDASGNEVMKVEEAVVATIGSIGFANRANAYMIDDVKIELNYDITPEPTKETTPTPNKTEEKATIEPTDNKGEKVKTESNWITYVLIGAGVLVLGGAIFILIKTSGKNNK